MALALLDQLIRLTPDERAAFVQTLTEDQISEIQQQPWWLVGRPEQQSPPGTWMIWLILAGRGWGKTRTGSEWLIDEILKNPTAPDGNPTEWAIIAETFSDTRVMCVDGPSGIMRVMERKGMKLGKDFYYNRSSWQINFGEGQRLHMFGADDKDAGRGYNLSGVWADEIAKWRYPYETWHEGIAPALRIGKRPRAVITTTPKPVKAIREWVKREDDSIYVTRGSTFDNAANLSATALSELRARYEGTRIGRQELHGEVLTDIEGALWNLENLDELRVELEI